MKVNFGSLNALLFLVCVMASFAVVAGPKAKILEYGFYEFTKGSERLENKTATSGFVTRGVAKLVEKTKIIPLKRGRLFGFRFQISNMDKVVGAIPLELIVTHPEMKKPDGSLSTGYRYTLNLVLKDGGVEDKTGYRINEAYEMVEGDWHFEYRFMNKMLVEHSFTTVKLKEVANKSKELNTAEELIEESQKVANKKD